MAGRLESDRWPDAVTASPAGPIRLMEGRGQGAFVDISPEVGLPLIPSAEQALFEDLFADGDRDLLLVVEGSLTLLENEGGVLIDQTEAKGLDSMIDVLRVAVVDADGAEPLDLLVETEQGNHLLVNASAGPFQKADLGPVRIATPSEEDRGPAGPGASFTPTPLSRLEPGPDLSEPHDQPNDRGGERRAGRIAAGGAPAGPTITTEEGEDYVYISGQLPAGCGSVMDLDSGNCLVANSVNPTLGNLYPMTLDFNLNAVGGVGFGELAQAGPFGHKMVIRGDNENVLKLTSAGGTKLTLGESNGVSLKSDSVGQAFLDSSLTFNLDSGGGVNIKAGTNPAGPGYIDLRPRAGDPVSVIGDLSVTGSGRIRFGYDNPYIEDFGDEKLAINGNQELVLLAGTEPGTIFGSVDLIGTGVTIGSTRDTTIYGGELVVNAPA